MKTDLTKYRGQVRNSVNKAVPMIPLDAHIKQVVRMQKKIDELRGQVENLGKLLRHYKTAEIEKGERAEAGQDQNTRRQADGYMQITGGPPKGEDAYQGQFVKVTGASELVRERACARGPDVDRL